MNFSLPEEYSAFQDTVHRWVEQEVPKSWARELERDEHNYPHAMWHNFTETGFHGIGIPEEYGGQGGDVRAHHQRNGAKQHCGKPGPTTII
jgi:acyl-CoA dehydrogenase